MRRLTTGDIIKRLGLEIHAEQADGGNSFDIACREVVIRLHRLDEYEDICDNPDTLKEAWEKQYAKKPNKDDFGRCTCPSCGWIVDSYWMNNRRYVRHCENCGQAIDWTVER